MMKTVRIIKNWKLPDLLRQTPGCSGRWGDVQFTTEPVEECDYALILNYVPSDISIISHPDHIWACMQEPCLPGIFDWVENGHDQFAKVFTHHIFNTMSKYVPTQTCLPWHVNKTYDELVAMPIPEKTRELSWIMSSKTVFPGHRKRMEFLNKYDTYMPFDCDVYGFGRNPLENKWDGLGEYKYSIAIENSYSPHYWTEKISDCFLSYTLPLYYGCSNLESYFPEKSFIRIDIDDCDKTARIIRDAVSGDLWRERLPAILEARELVLHKYQLFPFMVDYIRNHESFPASSYRHINLKCIREKI